MIDPIPFRRDGSTQPMLDAALGSSPTPSAALRRDAASFRLELLAALGNGGQADDATASAVSTSPDGGGDAAAVGLLEGTLMPQAARGLVPTQGSMPATGPAEVTATADPMKSDGSPRDLRIGPAPARVPSPQSGYGAFARSLPTQPSIDDPSASVNRTQPKSPPKSMQRSMRAVDPSTLGAVDRRVESSSTSVTGDGIGGAEVRSPLGGASRQPAAQRPVPLDPVVRRPLPTGSSAQKPLPGSSTHAVGTPPPPSGVRAAGTAAFLFKIGHRGAWTSRTDGAPTVQTSTDDAMVGSDARQPGIAGAERAAAVATSGGSIPATTPTKPQAPSDVQPSARYGLGMHRAESVFQVRQHLAGRPVQRLAIDLDDARVSVRFRNGKVGVEVLSDPSGVLGDGWARQVERTLDHAARAVVEPTGSAIHHDTSPAAPREGHNLPGDGSRGGSPRDADTEGREQHQRRHVVDPTDGEDR